MFLFGIIAWAASTAANFIIEYNWWKEVGQVDTWIGMLWYSIAPAAAGVVVAFIALWVGHSSGLRLPAFVEGFPPVLASDSVRVGVRGDRIRVERD